MNIIYMHTHDSGRYLSPYGYAVPTPHILEFAKSATLFRQAYCAGPTCSPSRAALLTGMSPHACGMQGLAHRGWRLNDYAKHLANVLKEAGYRTALCGIQHVAPDAEMIGYDEIIGHRKVDMSDTETAMSKYDRGNADAACAYIAAQKEPFFLSFGMFATHRPYEKAGSIDPDSIAPPAPLYDAPAIRRDMAEYHATAQLADECYGKVLEAIDRAGIRDETMVILTTDHGIAFPHMKCNLYDAGAGVALMIRLPKGHGQVKVTDALVSHLDIFPTVCDVAGIERPDWLEGTSLLPLMAGTAEKARDEVFLEVTYHAAYEPMRAVRTDRYKLIRRYDYHNGIVPANIDDGYAKTFLMDAGYGAATKPRDALYDLWIDPMERENLANDARYLSTYNDLSARLERWMLKTNDPLIVHGARVPKPEGAKANPLSCITPTSTLFEQQELDL